MTVRNGNVRGFGQLGVSLTGTGNIIDGVNASENRASGIFVWFGAVSNSTSSPETWVLDSSASPAR